MPFSFVLTPFLRAFIALIAVSFCSIAGADICSPDSIQLPPQLRAAGDAEIHLEADSLTADEARIVLQGDAEIVQGRRGLFAEKMVYDRQSERVHAAGEVTFYSENGDQIRADELDLAMHDYIGRGKNVRLKIADVAAVTGGINMTPVRARAAAKSVDFDGADYQQLHAVRLTNCVDRLIDRRRRKT